MNKPVLPCYYNVLVYTDIREVESPQSSTLLYFLRVSIKANKSALRRDRAGALALNQPEIRRWSAGQGKQEREREADDEMNKFLVYSAVART